ncbi:hypothetical protein HG535_0D03490 [Zygotorulaspora mrakii]|uniref:AAA+ ATPase domain-containing protein n=1 Tax=Zygotorulaspora mrakii TaxID=42260 RepID=A0A7H9B1X3_ZYGMR|nr:uncharacterized protein HG535_0D03490 [Zygotorulaspora mrakii]QLG72641.1 hypothetical protein HG535_0D03490 [Zygotorulaspora mrakii]
MSDLFNFAGLTGGSTLFDTGDVIEHRAIHDDRENDHCEQRATEFTSSCGKVVKLRKKKVSVAEGLDATRLGYAKSAWRNDETYGININALLDRIEAKNEAKGGLSSRYQTHSKRHRSELLVEKWRPRNFLDLVGNDKTNRRILRWLRQWSPCVFNEALPRGPQKKPQENTEDNSEDEELLDPLQRPQKRILLIHGPPGVGKTSVTHVVAKQAGFSVVEINASDERAGTVVRDKTHNTLFNHTFNESAVCLVADEIDGSVESGFIKVLIDIVSNDAKATQKLILGSQLKVKSKKKKKSSKMLLRPIIAICNNLYAPALEKLKPHCEIISFKRPSDSSLQERLERICQIENLEIAPKTLKELMDLSQGDVRSCINNLQFLSSNQEFNSEVQVGVANKLESSSKDFSTSWFRICNALFRKDPRADPKSEIKELTRQVELNGNYERLVHGCHSLYLLEKYSDNGLMKPAALSDWLIFHDLMFKSLFDHNGELLRYCSITPLAFYNYFSDIANREDMRIKNSDFEFKEKQKSNLDVCRLLQHRITVNMPSRAPFISQQSLISHILPFVDYMLSSDVNKCRDLKLRQSIYDLMVGVLREFQLTLQPKYHEGLETRNLLGIEPPIENIVLLDEKRQKETLTKRPPIYNVLLAKSEESKARKRHRDQVTREKDKNLEIRSKKAKSGANSVDFFKIQYGLGDKRQPDSKAAVNDKLNKREKKDGVRIWVKYKEGFSDAVRKNVSWKDLWS